MQIELPPSEPQTAFILCADCGVPIEPSASNLCINCLQSSVDISDSITKQATVSYCRNCTRYLSPPQTWILAELESRQLLAICLKKLKGLKEVRLIDARFVWTEPHSKRIRVKLTIQKEVMTGTILQQIFEVIYVVNYTQCPDCTRLAAKNTWKAVVQVRQKVPHKRTFLFLEQLILKHGADKDTISIKESHDGLDFYYSSRSHAVKMTEFLAAVVPVRTKSSDKLISVDIHTSTTNHKYSYSVEIAPMCKDDLICLPKRLAHSLSNIGQLVVCTRVGNSIHLVDPYTLHYADLSAPIYWRQPFSPLASISAAVEFMVLDIEEVDWTPQAQNQTHTSKRMLLADAQVTPASGNMQSDAIYHTRTHLGGILNAGDTVLGYFLTNTNYNNDDFEALQQSRIPEVILVRKTYPDRKKNKKRKWRLKTMAKEADVEHAGLGRSGAGGKDEAEYEMFLRDLEEDEDMRAGVNLWKVKKRAAQIANGMDVDDAVSTADTESTMGDDDIPRIRVDELLDDFEEMRLETDAAAEGSDAESEVEAR